VGAHLRLQAPLDPALEPHQIALDGLHLRTRAILEGLLAHRRNLLVRRGGDARVATAALPNRSSVHPANLEPAPVVWVLQQVADHPDRAWMWRTVSA
jgi:hypothetical protein